MGDNLPINGNKQPPKTGFTAGLSAGVQKNRDKMMPNSVVQIGLQNGNTAGHVDIGYGGVNGMTSLGLGVEHDVDLGDNFSLDLSANARVGRENQETHLSATSEIYTNTNYYDNSATAQSIANANLDYHNVNFKAEAQVVPKINGENFSFGVGVKGGFEAYTTGFAEATGSATNDISGNGMLDAQTNATARVGVNTQQKFSASPVVEADLTVGKNKNTTISLSGSSDDVHLGVTQKFGGKKQKTQPKESNTRYEL